MIEPVYHPAHHIYDVFHNDDDHLILILPAEAPPATIQQGGATFQVHICAHNHTLVYSLPVATYTPVITLTINGVPLSTRVNKYPTFKDELIFSTIVKNEDAYMRPWIDFHAALGITRFIIYDNSTAGTLESLLADYIKREQVLLIRWTYPYLLRVSGCSGQTTQQNHSIYAFQQSRAIGLFDIDEYVNPQMHATIGELLDSFALDVTAVGSVRLLEKRFFNPDRKKTHFLKIDTCESVNKVGCQKNFVFPKNVTIFSVHMIVEGKPMFEVDERIAFFNHYYFLNKTMRGFNRPTRTDNSILRHINH